MRRVGTPAVMFAAGLACGWVLHDAGSAAPSSPDGSAHAAMHASAGPARDGEAPLTGLAVPPRPTQVGEAAASDEPGALRSARQGGRGFEALALVYALSEQDADFLTLVRLAVQGGVSADRILDVIGDLPREQRGALLGAVLAQHPDLDWDAYTTARIFEKAGEGARALEITHEALRLREDVSRSLTRLLLRLDPQNGAAFLLQDAPSHGWGEDSLRTLRGLLAEADQEAALAPFLLRALDTNPRDAMALALLADVDPPAAVARAQALLAETPGDARTWSLLGDLHLHGGDRDRAFAAFLQAAERSPGPSALADLVAADAVRAVPALERLVADTKDDEAIGVLAQAYLEAGQKDRAAQAFARALEADPDDDEWVRGLIAADPRQAAAVLGAAIDRAPGAATDDMLGRHGEALQAAGRTEAAFARYLDAHRRNPDDHAWQLAMAHLEPRRAAEVLGTYVLGATDDASGFGAYGVALAGSGRYAEAVPQLERAIADGNAELWYRELAPIEPERALDALRRRAERDRNRPDTWGVLGNALQEAGRQADAADAYRRALALDPESRRWLSALRGTR